MPNLDIFLLVQEFYAMEAMSVLLGQDEYGDFRPLRHSHDRWYRDFQEFRDHYTSQLATAIYDYTVLTVAAELRHAYRCASHFIRDYFRGAHGRDGVYRDCIIYDPTDLLMTGIRLFDPKQVKWKRQYGGKPWWRIAKAGLLKGKVGDGIFIDHCVDLSHNCNVYFDKGAGIFRLWDGKAYARFLDRKRLCAPHELLQGTVGQELNRLLRRADTLRILRGCPDELSPSEEYNETERQVLGYTPIVWGNKPLNAVILENKEVTFRKEQADRRNEESEGWQILKMAA